MLPSELKSCALTCTQTKPRYKSTQIDNLLHFENLALIIKMCESKLNKLRYHLIRKCIVQVFSQNPIFIQKKKSEIVGIKII